MGSSSNILAHFGLLIWMCSCVLVLVHSVPVEIVYTGEACGCPAKLGYQILAPVLPKPRPYRPSQYGYRVEVPVQAKTKVSYSFDFVVEEPRTPPPPKPKRLKLFAKVDRIALNKADCPPTPYYAPAVAPPCPRKQPQLYATAAIPPPCTCGQCDLNKPLDRYVNTIGKIRLPCRKCRHFNCKCNMVRTITSNDIADISENLIDFIDIDATNSAGSKIGNNIRRKRELPRGFLRPERFEKERRGRFVKLYHKNLPNKRQAFFALDGFPKTLLNKQFFLKTKKIAKRDIKGEYDMLERDAEQMDLTLPDIVQYMPETLQPNFKRGRCAFACNINNQQEQQKQQLEEQRNQQTEKNNDKGSDYNSNNNENANKQDNANENESKNAAFDENYANSNKINENANSAIFIVSSRSSDSSSSSSKNTINNDDNKTAAAQSQSTTKNNIAAHTKRNADYHENYGIPSISAQSASHIPIKQLLAQLPSYFAENAQKTVATPTAIDKNSYGATAAAAQTQAVNSAQSSQQYVYDQLAHKYIQNNGRLRLKASAVPDPTGSDAAPLHYAGELETNPSSAADYGSVAFDRSAATLRQYPVQHISNEELDKVISDIIYKHPAFLDATTHLDGALVDPEPWQEQETKDFIKKLLEGRFNYLFNTEDETAPASPYTVSQQRLGAFALAV